VLYWCTIGGTSLASPLIASVFALAGGAQGVEYPAQTLYENAVAAPASLHDVTAGSNAECLLPFDEGTGAQPCSAAEEASTSCSSRLICLAAKGYDGPTGVGTPDGIAAFQPPSGTAGGKPAGSEESGKGGSGAGTGGGSPTGPGTSGPPAAGGAGAAPASAGTSTTAAVPTIQLSGLALTLKALIALNSSRPRVSQIAFTFTLNVAAHVRVSLQRRVVSHGRGRWQARTRPLTLAALAGHNSRRLGGHGVLPAGSYRLTLTPAHGAAHEIVFEIG